MALIYKATLTPGKWELLQDWIPRQPWCAGIDAADLEVVGAFRFDDPAGEVGLETHLMAAADGTVLQVPVTYRGAPLPGATLIGPSQHSVLGPRWLYDGCTDPAFVGVLAATILTGGHQAEYLVDQGDGTTVARPTTAHATGSGRAAQAPAVDTVRTEQAGPVTVMRTDDVTLRLLRVLPGELAAGDDVLTATWAGRPDTVLAALDRRR